MKLHISVTDNETLIYYYHRYRHHCCYSRERINKIVMKTVTVSDEIRNWKL